MGEVVVSSEEVEVLKTVNEAEEMAEGGGERRRKRYGLVKWERFLPKIALRVLLIEADDSTRQIIAALLRKCSYRVAAVPDGLKAWEILKARTQDIDLILTEVDLPSISGYALLTLIMEHEICKNIPVIMMSSHDSVSTVYKYMLRGAADYLVKPLRRNELRNLWQHVWRRKSSLAEDESVGQQNTEAASENQSATNKEQKEKENNAESSCTKPDIENNTQDLSQKNSSKVSLDDANRQEIEPKANNGALYNANVANATYDEPGKSPKEATDFMGALLFRTNNKFTTNNGVSNLDPQLELHLSLRRSQPIGLKNNHSWEERPVLQPSNASAFTRYVNRQTQKQCLILQGISDQNKQFGINHNNKNPNSPGPQPPPNIQTSWLDQSSYPMSVPVKCSTFNGINSNNNDHPSTAYGSGIPPVFVTQSSMSPIPSPSSVSPQDFTSWRHPLDGKGHVSPTIEHSRIRGFSNGVHHGASASRSNSNVDHHISAAKATDNTNAEDENEKGCSEPVENCRRSLQREAALTKFRIKRKDRCFEKKIRYESRKKLAEHRPRVKGQFVRQDPLAKAAQDNKGNSPDV